MICLNNVSKAFFNKTVLNSITFTADKGKVYGLVGKNGAGKTTLMNIISGLLPIDRGECLINNAPVDNTTLSTAKIGYLRDIPVFYDYLSAKDYLLFLLSSISDNETENIKRADYLLKLVNLTDSTIISKMSRGMKQRLGIASILVHNPNILLLDEPTSALDPTGRAEVIKIISKLKSHNKIIIISSHILGDMEYICDNVLFINNGCIIRNIDMSMLYSSDNEYVIQSDMNSDYFYSLIAQSSDYRVLKVSPSILTVIVKDNTIIEQNKLINLLSSSTQKIISFSIKKQTLYDIYNEVIR